jgi:virulence-associated protein VapD
MDKTRIGDEKIMSKAIKIKGKTEDDIKKQLIKHGFGNYNNSSIANGKKLKDMKMAPSIMQIFHDLKRQGKIMENSINEIRKGDYVNSMGEIGLVNKVKGQVAYVKFPSRPGSFHPILASSLKKSGKKVKGKDIYTESKVNEKKKGPGLWANIHAKRKRGEAPAKPGDEDYPDEKAWKDNTDEVVHEMSATAKKHGKFGQKGVPFPTEKPNEFAYLDFIKWAKKKEGKIKKQMSILKDDRIFRAMEMVWQAWDVVNDGAFSNIKGNKFGRELVKMMWKDNVVFNKKSNKIITIKEFAGKLYEASSIWKHLDAKWKLQDEIIDLEMDMKEITKDIAQLHRDMEQEAEPGGGKIADRYGRDIEKKEKEYKKKKAEFKKLMAKLDRMEQY